MSHFPWIDHELQHCLDVIDAILNDRDFSEIGPNAARAGWFSWSALAANGEWA